MVVCVCMTDALPRVERAGLVQDVRRGARPCRCRAAGEASSTSADEAGRRCSAERSREAAAASLGQHAGNSAAAASGASRFLSNGVPSIFASARTRPLRARISSLSRGQKGLFHLAVQHDHAGGSTSRNGPGHLSIAVPAFTRARSCTTLKGFVKKSSAPASRMRDSSSPLAVPLNITILRLRRWAGCLAQAAQHFLAAEAGQIDVEQDQVVRPAAGDGDGVRPGPDLVAGQPVGGQGQPAEPADVGLVVDDQHPVRAGRGVRRERGAGRVGRGRRGRRGGKEDGVTHGGTAPVAAAGGRPAAAARGRSGVRPPPHWSPGQLRSPAAAARKNYPIRTARVGRLPPPPAVFCPAMRVEKTDPGQRPG